MAVDNFKRNWLLSSDFILFQVWDKRFFKITSLNKWFSLNIFLSTRTIKETTELTNFFIFEKKDISGIVLYLSLNSVRYYGVKITTGNTVSLNS